MIASAIFFLTILIFYCIIQKVFLEVIMAKNNDNSLWKSWFGVGSARSSIFLMASIFFAFISVCDEAGMFNDKSNLYEDTKLVASSEAVDRIVENLEDVLDVEICEEEVDEYCLLNAILLNKNLSDSDKEFFINI